MNRELAAHPIKWKRLLKRAAAERTKTNVSRYSEIERSLKMTVTGMKQRCTNKNNAAWERYGGRGIQFRFDSVEHAIRWLAANLGAKPKDKSVDRIDNNGHYEPGNLRWATALEQGRNKGTYRRTVNGERLRRLLPLRPDYTAQGLYRYIHAGYSDEHIIAMQKPPGGRKRAS